MKIFVIYSIFILFTINSIISIAPTAFADHHEMIIETADNDLATPGCMETEVGCYTPNTATVDVGAKIIMTNVDVTGIIHTHQEL